MARPSAPSPRAARARGRGRRQTLTARLTTTTVFASLACTRCLAAAADVAPACCDIRCLKTGPGVQNTSLLRVKDVWHGRREMQGAAAVRAARKLPLFAVPCIGVGVLRGRRGVVHERGRRAARRAPLCLRRCPCRRPELPNTRTASVAQVHPKPDAHRCMVAGRPASLPEFAPGPSTPALLLGCTGARPRTGLGRAAAGTQLRRRRHHWTGMRMEPCFSHGRLALMTGTRRAMWSKASPSRRIPGHPPPHTHTFLGGEPWS